MSRFDRYNESEKGKARRKRYELSEKGRARVRAYRRRKQDQGLCPRCLKEPAINVACWSCLNDMEERRSLAIS